VDELTRVWPLDEREEREGSVDGREDGGGLRKEEGRRGGEPGGVSGRFRANSAHARKGIDSGQAPWVIYESVRSPSPAPRGERLKSCALNDETSPFSRPFPSFQDLGLDPSRES
jgi:hypothetical protein